MLFSSNHIKFLQVKWWSTFNEVHIMSMYGYGIYGQHAPGLLDWQETAVYNVTQNTLLAHAEAYHVYDREFRASQQGQHYNYHRLWINFLKKT